MTPENNAIQTTTQPEILHCRIRVFLHKGTAFTDGTMMRHPFAALREFSSVTYSTLGLNGQTHRWFSYPYLINLNSEGLVQRLVVHLGLPKTATTSLQTHIFPEVPGYVGKFPALGYPSGTLGKVIERYAYGDFVNGSQVSEFDGEEVWIPALESWIHELLASDQEIIPWSDEGLAEWRSPVGNFLARSPVDNAPGACPRRGSHRIIGFLQHLASLLPKGIELKTMLTLRKQGDWLGSLATQRGVSDTTFVERLIRDNDAFLDFNAIVDDLERVLGPENHLTLVFENGLEHNVLQMLDFAGYQSADFPNLVALMAQGNVRRGAEGWRVHQNSPLDGLK